MNQIASYREKANRIQVATRRIYGESDTGRALDEMCGTLLRDLDDIENQRGMKEQFVAVIGHKNAGKSTLCRLLVDDAGKRGLIRAGMGEKEKYSTLRITWIGPSAPHQLDMEMETALFVQQEQMADIGVPYSLVDVPGFGDDNAAARQAARRALRMSGTAIVVWNFARLEDESALEYLQLCDGARVLPVVVSSSYSRKVDDHRMPGELESLRRRIKDWCPESEVMDPVLIPMLDEAEDTVSRSELETEARKKIATVLAEQLRRPSPDPARLATGRFSRFLVALTKELQPFLDRVSVPYENLIKEEKQAARMVGEQIAGKPRQLRAGLRLRMLTILRDQCPVIFFPFRSFLGLLTLVAGAWDRLILGLFGSLPSLALAVLQSGKNARQLAENRKASRDDLHQRCASLAAGHLTTVNRKFLSAIIAGLPEEAKARFSRKTPKINLAGLEEVASAAENIFDQKLQEQSPRGVIVRLFGFLSLPLWLGLVAGPVWTIYDKFFQAWGLAFDGSAPGSWAQFPAPSAGMIFSTLLLVFGPVFLMSMLALGLSLSQKRVNNCADATIDATREMLDTFISNGLFRLETNDELRAAMRTLLDELRDGEANTPNSKKEQ
jgi:hypothetical protein